MEESSDLEEYLRDAAIDFVGVFETAHGGGHPDKELVLFRGGIGALAKLVHDSQTEAMARSEVAAYVLAHELGWDDLVPVTVYRDVPTPEGAADASVQILWPAFRAAVELGISEQQVAE